MTPTKMLTRWMWPAVLATGLGTAAMLPAPAQANDDLVRVIVDVADVMMRGSTPYYRHGGYDDRLQVSYDRYGRPVYYRSVPRHHNNYRPGPPPHARAYGYRNDNRHRQTKCDSRGRCTVQYYDPRQDRRNRR
ncbi:hypothetical protein [Luteimonas deserti]|uniref:Uncharacterized protein n=1 Tax=Luteimonas deserti TaxID=2752306 RepID=A0A7Z0QQ54_9GAMM|nr:hypothetical protein [Luteimonas deserti]NYZ62144.1 hypothetical protein [Luteimonas deserti]